MQSADYLPQHREHLYTVRLRRDALGAGILAPPRLPRQAQLLRTRLADILHQGLPTNCEEYIHGQQRANLMVAKHRTLAYQPQGEDRCHCFPIDHDPTMLFAPGHRSDGNVCTWRVFGQGSSFAFHWQHLHCTSRRKCLEAVGVTIGASWRIGSFDNPKASELVAAE